jgi:hypothetical protein
MLTRLVPIFPFNLQNYAYGLTRIRFWPYLITSSICILPATAAFTFAGGALSEGRGDVKRTLLYLAIAGVLLVLVSLIPRLLQRKSALAGGLLKAAAIAAILGAALPAQAVEGDAYARLLKAHVRSGMVSGIKLSLVDYGAVKTDPDYARALGALAEARPGSLACDAERVAFWVNAYNLAAIKAVLDRYPAGSIKDSGSLLSPIWKKKLATVGGDGKTARVSSIFKWFAGDFSASGGVAAFIRAKAGPELSSKLGALTDAGLSYLDYDWSLNDTARSS